MAEVDDLLKEKLDIMNPERVERENFLDLISQLESSGGRNFNHPEIESGIHQGQRAIGRFGLMPNTVKEIINRAGDNVSSQLRSIASEEPNVIKNTLESNPEMEYQLADQLAKRVLETQGNPEKAAYTWFEGHNLSPEEVEARNYPESEYVKRFNKLRQKLGYK